MKKIMMFVGAVTTGIAAGVLVKKYLQKDKALAIRARPF